MLGSGLCLLGGVGAKDEDQVTSVPLGFPAGVHRQPPEAAALWPHLNQPPQGRSLVAGLGSLFQHSRLSGGGYSPGRVRRQPPQ